MKMYGVDDDDDDDDISILSAKSVPFNSKPKIHVLFDRYNNEVKEDQKKAAAAAAALQGNKINPILVENYDHDLQLAINGSLFSSIQENNNSNKKREFDDFVSITQNDVRIKKIFKGESSNSKSVIVIDDPTTFLCDICVDEKPMSAVFRIQGCNHSYCSVCIAKYVASKLQENIKNITCPVMGCEGMLDPQHCSSILPRQVFDRWGDALCEAMVLASEKFYCPFKDCSALLINDLSVRGGVKILESECPDCHRLFCAQCKVAWHSEVSSCEEFQKLNKNEREREDILMMKLAKTMRWNRCPHCGFYVEKVGGCSSVHCRCSRGFTYK